MQIVSRYRTLIHVRHLKSCSYFIDYNETTREQNCKDYLDQFAILPNKNQTTQFSEKKTRFFFFINLRQFPAK